MSRQDANAAFALTSFLYGGNAAYVEDLYARYEADPQSVDEEWRAFFESLKDDPADVLESARGPSWKKQNGALLPRDELVGALTGEWAEIEQRLGGRIKAKAQSAGVEISAARVQPAT